ncbi:MAG: DUF3870 domain-containing protein [Lachnospiraceae bacterium]|nr:DUF3870 domain-containing protein [Lachnospiraceae bacterium]
MEKNEKEEGRTSSYYVIGESRTQRDNAITVKYGSFYMAFEVDSETEEVLDFGCTHTLKITEDYLKRWFVGADFPEIEEWLENRLAHRYGGSSRRAIVTAYHDALKRYRAMKKSEEEELGVSSAN